MSGAANAKRILNERLRDDCEDAKCDLSKAQDLTRAFDLDLVEAMGRENGRVDGVADDAMKLDAKMTQKVEHFRDAVTSYRSQVARLREKLELG